MASLWVKRKFLGNGSYGQVFLAQSAASLAYYKSPALVPFVALKSCLARRSSSLRLERDVFRELGACDGIVKCFGSGVSVENGVEYFDLVLEYAPGGSLEHLLRFRGGRIPEFEASCSLHHGKLQGVATVPNSEDHGLPEDSNQFPIRRVGKPFRFC